MIETQKIASLLGGKAVFHKPIQSELALFEAVNLGLPVYALEKMLELHLLSKPEVVQLVAPPRTLARRKKQSRLSPVESDRLARIARILSYAEDVIGSREKAHTWLRRPNHALEGRTPLSLLEAESGARAVETVLARIEHGVYS